MQNRLQNYDYSFYLQNIKGIISPYSMENMYFCIGFAKTTNKQNIIERNNK